MDKQHAFRCVGGQIASRQWGHLNFPRKGEMGEQHQKNGVNLRYFLAFLAFFGRAACFLIRARIN